MQQRPRRPSSSLSIVASRCSRLPSILPGAVVESCSRSATSVRSASVLDHATPTRCMASSIALTWFLATNPAKRPAGPRGVARGVTSRSHRDAAEAEAPVVVALDCRVAVLASPLDPAGRCREIVLPTCDVGALGDRARSRDADSARGIEHRARAVQRHARREASGRSEGSRTWRDITVASRCSRGRGARRRRSRLSRLGARVSPRTCRALS